MCLKNCLLRVASIYSALGLVKKILIGVCVGVLLAFVPIPLSGVGLLGDIFVGLLKAVAPSLVFLLILSSLVQDSGKIDSRFGLVILYYLTSTLLASIVAVAGSFLFPQSLRIEALEQSLTNVDYGIGETLRNLLIGFTLNPIAALVEGKFVAILFWAALLGLALKECASVETKRLLLDISNGASTIVRWIIQLAPLGIMGLVYQSVVTHGVGAFSSYGKLILLLVGCMATVALIVNPLIVFVSLRRNPYPLVFRCLRESGVTAFFTRSSAANIPVNMAFCEKMGVDSTVYSVSIPLGATINMNGAAITIAVMTLAAANTLGLQLTFPTALLLCVLSALGACGASGVAGGSLLLIPMACSLFGISHDYAMEVVAVGFIISVVQDSCETALNSSADALFTLTADYCAKIKEGRELPNC